MENIATFGQEAPPKAFEIIVNTRPKTVESEYVSYEQIVSLAFDPVPSGDYIEISVRYHDGPRGSKGSLTQGQETKIVDGMVFYAKATDRS